MQLIRRGQRSASVADLQTRLEKLGFDIPLDESSGSFGAGTEAAVRGFQQDRGLVVDGLVGDATWREIVESSWHLGDRLLTLSDPPLRGDDVTDLQVRLSALGFATGKHDGIFGLRTAEALREFQKNLEIGEDGIAGRETVRSLVRLRLVTKTGLGSRIHERESRMSGAGGITGKLIVLDPGHGGDDLGELGPSADREAEITFRLAARVAQLLDDSGADTTLTRGPHDGAPESARAAIANEIGADLLVSIHLNGNESHSAKGAATYFFESSGVASEPGEHLASLIQRNLVILGSLDCRSHGKTYPILRETSMPAVVVEPCFITNPDEVRSLEDPEHFHKIAGAIASGIEQYYSA
ncbi:MAG: N-acetylmuramoyl-L-alanine amidase [Actinomycetota bacterium]|nr:N-acetylmuramoyl-L-alanine amidase [Actinomycetota bacterium]